MGDAAGIGPEVAVRAAADPFLRRRCDFLLIGSLNVFREQARRTGAALALRRLSAGERREGSGEEVPVLQPPRLPSGPVRPGRVSAAWGRAAMECVERGVKLVLAGGASALVTAPINKEGIHRAGYRFQGHTDFLAHLTGARSWAMMLVGGRFRVTLCTVHIPLSRVSRSLSREGIAEKIRLTHQALLRLGVSRPRIAVAGLNPHAGEAGAFGDEEARIITPAVAACRRAGLPVEGPLPPDTVFYRHRRGDYDAVVAMYHDQGLIPLKTLAFDRGVNLTLGLPLVRTSPDHGTAYELAGRGRADPRSMIEAVKLACRLASK